MAIPLPRPSPSLPSLSTGSRGHQLSPEESDPCSEAAVPEAHPARACPRPVSPCPTPRPPPQKVLSSCGFLPPTIACPSLRFASPPRIRLGNSPDTYIGAIERITDTMVNPCAPPLHPKSVLATATPSNPLPHLLTLTNYRRPLHSSARRLSLTRASASPPARSRTSRGSSRSLTKSWVSAALLPSPVTLFSPPHLLLSSSPRSFSSPPPCLSLLPRLESFSYLS